MLSGTSAFAVSTAPLLLQRARSLGSHRRPSAAPNSQSVAPRKTDSSSRRNKNNNRNTKAMASATDDNNNDKESAQDPSPEAPSTAPPNVAELVMLLKVRAIVSEAIGEALGVEKAIPRKGRKNETAREVEIDLSRCLENNASLSPNSTSSSASSSSRFPPTPSLDTDRPRRGRQRRARRALVRAIPRARNPLRLRGGDDDDDEQRRRDSSKLLVSLFPFFSSRHGLHARPPHALRQRRCRAGLRLPQGLLRSQGGGREGLLLFFFLFFFFERRRRKI